MAEFLQTARMNERLHDLIKNASRELLLVSPYLRINRQLQELLADQLRGPLDVHLVYGKKEKLEAGQVSFLKSVPRMRISFREDLHAKCYLSEQAAIIGSMNLYEHSQVNNDEMGILVRRDTDAQLYADIREDAMRIARVAKPVAHHDLGGEAEPAARPSLLRAFTGRVSSPGPALLEPASRKAVVRDEGFCIRCAEPIALDPDRPYCTPHYKVWAHWSDPDYEDPHCHGCGRATGASMAKPLCRTCYKRLET